MTGPPPPVPPAMSGSLDEIVQVGFDMMATKYYVIGVEALYFYDYLLTLSDEVEYIWKGKRTWTFYLFILNRYITMFFAGWMNPAISLTFPKSVCNKTAILELIFFTWVTFIAQVYMIARIYALTQRNRIITGFFVVLAAAQTVFSVAFLASPDNTVMQLPDIKLDPFYICAFTTSAKLGSAYTSLLLAFDFCAFVAVVVSAYRSMPASLAKDLMFTGVIGAVVQGATVYFALVFTSELVLAMFIFFGRDSLKLMSAPGSSIFIPMMVSRLCISLKKSADPRSAARIWHADHFSRAEGADVERFAMGPVERPTAGINDPETPC